MEVPLKASRQSRAPTRPAGNSKAPAAFQGFVVRADIGFEQFGFGVEDVEHVAPRAFWQHDMARGVLQLPPLLPPKEEKESRKAKPRKSPPKAKAAPAVLPRLDARDATSKPARQDAGEDGPEKEIQKADRVDRKATKQERHRAPDQEPGKRQTSSSQEKTRKATSAATRLAPPVLGRERPDRQQPRTMSAPEVPGEGAGSNAASRQTSAPAPALEEKLKRARAKAKAKARAKDDATTKAASAVFFCLSSPDGREQLASDCRILSEIPRLENSSRKKKAILLLQRSIVAPARHLGGKRRRRITILLRHRGRKVQILQRRKKARILLQILQHRRRKVTLLQHRRRKVILLLLQHRRRKVTLLQHRRRKVILLLLQHRRRKVTLLQHRRRKVILLLLQHRRRKVTLLQHRVQTPLFLLCSVGNGQAQEAESETESDPPAAQASSMSHSHLGSDIVLQSAVEKASDPPGSALSQASAIPATAAVSGDGIRIEWIEHLPEFGEIVGLQGASRCSYVGGVKMMTIEADVRLAEVQDDPAAEPAKEPEDDEHLRCRKERSMRILLSDWYDCEAALQEEFEPDFSEEEDDQELTERSDAADTVVGLPLSQKSEDADQIDSKRSMAMSFKDKSGISCLLRMMQPLTKAGAPAAAISKSVLTIFSGGREGKRYCRRQRFTKAMAINARKNPLDVCRRMQPTLTLLMPTASRLPAIAADSAEKS
ncbi:unnamed protein product [Symbiodinium sp. CCMP2592]|nr:unnamed protein product [Symbiodinium sp. CCMP2592]